jgi:tyrosyl-tRNA synthetase
MKLSEELKWRGFVAQNTFNKITDLDTKKHTFYLGADPSQDSMTIGNLAAMMMCKVFIRHGYKPILLVGGATGQIGDPKMDKERPLKPVEEIEQNARGIEQQFKRIMGDKIKIVNNKDWLGGLKLYKFLGEVGQYFSMTQLLDRDFVKARTGEGGSGLSMAEFSYALLQGYDFLHLYREYGVDLQLCGVDQIGNVLSGIHLIDKSEHAKAYVWSCPLVLDKDGKKFGKSEGNAIWLSSERTSAYSFYQFWLNIDDEMVEKYLKIYTLLEKSAVDDLMKRHAEDPAARLAQKTLAHEVTKLVHGSTTADGVKRATEALFGSQGLSPEILPILQAELPTFPKGSTVVEILTKAGFASSNGEALRLIKGNAISLNGQKITADQPITAQSLLKKGKNQFILIK